MSKVIKQEDMSEHLQSNASSNQSGSNDFVKKLFQMLQEDSYKAVVRWTKLGDSFVVIDTNEFTKDILPRHFKHSNFASFVRQLNKYDFHKVKISNEAKRNYEYGDDAWEFKHPEFRVNDIDALDNIKRKGTTSKKNGLSNGPTTTSSADQMLSRVNKLQEQVDQYKQENTQLNHQLDTMNGKFKYLMDYLVTVKLYEERNYASINLLMNSLTQVGIKLPPLDFPNPSMIGMGYNEIGQPVRAPSQSQSQQQSPAQPIKPPHSRSQSHNQNQLGSPEAPLQINDGGRQPGGVVAPVAPIPTSLGPSVGVEFNGKEPQSPRSGARSVGSNSPPNPAITTTNIPNPKFHVLLVEDDNVCIQLCRKFLVKYGCQVTVVTDGLNAISTVEKTKYDLVLMDIVMPNLDGATATSVIRSFDTKTPIIAMTGNIEDNDLVNYLQNGMSDILAKPFTKDDLYSILAKHLLTTNDGPVTQLSPNDTPQGLSDGDLNTPGGSFLGDLPIKKQRLL